MRSTISSRSSLPYQSWSRHPPSRRASHRPPTRRAGPRRYRRPATKPPPSCRGRSCAGTAPKSSASNLSNSPDVRVLYDLVVRSDQVAIVYSRGCDDDLISRVAMKRSRQAGRLNGDLRRQLQESHSRIGKRGSYPIRQFSGKLDSSILVQFRHLPEEMALTPIRSSSLRLMASRWATLNRAVSSVHHTHACVSTTITCQQPTHPRQRDRRDDQGDSVHPAADTRSLASTPTLQPNEVLDPAGSVLRVRGYISAERRC